MSANRTRDLPDQAAEAATNKPKIVGYCIRKDARISTRSGTIRVEAHRPIKDAWIIQHLKASGLKLEPLYE